MQWLINIDTFLGLLSRSPSLALPFRSCEIYQLQLTNCNIVGIPEVLWFNCYRKDWMTAWTGIIKIMLGYDSLFGAVFEKIKDFASGVHFKDVKIFNYELFFLGPPYSEAILPRTLHCFFIGWCQVGYCLRIKKIVYFLIIDLKKTAGYLEMPLLVMIFWLTNPLEQLYHCSLS